MEQKKKRRKKRSKRQSSEVVHRFEHKFKIDPFKLHHMENILGKVCVEKKEVGIQCEPMMLLASSRQAESSGIEENCNRLKRLNQKKIMRIKLNNPSHVDLSIYTSEQIGSVDGGKSGFQTTQRHTPSNQSMIPGKEVRKLRLQTGNALQEDFSQPPSSHALNSTHGGTHVIDLNSQQNHSLSAFQRHQSTSAARRVVPHHQLRPQSNMHSRRHTSILGDNLLKTQAFGSQQRAESAEGFLIQTATNLNDVRSRQAITANKRINIQSSQELLQWKQSS